MSAVRARQEELYYYGSSSLSLLSDRNKFSGKCIIPIIILVVINPMNISLPVNADVFEVPEKLFKSRDTFYWMELKDKRIEKQYFLLIDVSLELLIPDCCSLLCLHFSLLMQEHLKQNCQLGNLQNK